jgi:transposase-like protein
MTGKVAARADRPRVTKHDEQVKLRALAHYASSGSLTATAEAVGLPKQSIHNWTSSEQGAELVGQLRTSLRHAVAADLVTVTRKAVSEIMDRLDNGDEVVHNGEIIRRRVTAKDAMYIAANANSMHMMLTQDAKAVASANLKRLAGDLIDALKSADAASNAVTIEAEPHSPG